MLEGNIEIRSNPGIFCHQIKELLLHAGRMQVKKPYPGNICLCQNMLQQFDKPFTAFQVQAVGKKVLGDKYRPMSPEGGWLHE